MNAVKRNKYTISATVSPYLKEQVEELVATGKFSSMSDVVSIALSEFVGAYKREQKEKAAATAFEDPEHKKPSWNVIHQ